MSRVTLKIGTRGSELALTQTRMVIARLVGLQASAPPALSPEEAPGDRRTGHDPAD